MNIEYCNEITKLLQKYFVYGAELNKLNEPKLATWHCSIFAIDICYGMRRKCIVRLPVYTKGHQTRNHKKRKSNKIYLFSSNQKSVRSFVRLSSAYNKTPFINYLSVYAHTAHENKRHSQNAVKSVPFWRESNHKKATIITVRNFLVTWLMRQILFNFPSFKHTIYHKMICTFPFGIPNKWL